MLSIFDRSFFFLLQKTGRMYVWRNVFLFLQVGVKFVITATPGTNSSEKIEPLLQGIYELYADYVLKVRQKLYNIDSHMILSQILFWKM